MKRILVGLLLLSLSSVAHAASTEKVMHLENLIRDRVLSVVHPFDPYAMAEVHLNVRTVTSNLPGIGMEAQVTPVEYDGELGSSGIEGITIRVVTQGQKLPTWLQAEVKKATELRDVRVNITFDKAKGTIKDTQFEKANASANERASAFTKLAKDSLESVVNGISFGFDQVKLGYWGLLGVLLSSLLLIAFSIRGISSRLEIALGRMIEEKVVPALAQARSGGRDVSSARSEAKESKGAAPVLPAAVSSGEKELAELPIDTVLALLCDCYWTESDAYAHYIWNQINQEQREKVLAAKLIDATYFSYVMQFEPANLNYHFDSRYLSADPEFRTRTQDELLAWLYANKEQYKRVTPLRWDLLPLTLEERIEFNEVNVQREQVEAIRARKLVLKMQLKSLRTQDEEYILANSTRVPLGVRASLRSLVWLALTPLDYRRKILADLDAKQIAEAWIGPAAALESLKEALPEKKAEMLEHFLTTYTPSRDSDVFSYLVDAGLQAPISLTTVTDVATPASEAA